MAVTARLVNPNGGGANFVHSFSVPDQASHSETGTAGNATTITISAVTGKPIILAQVAWSYSAAPTGGAITIADGTITRDLHVTAAGPGFWYFDPPLSFTPGAAVTITLAAPGGAVVGKLNCVTYVH